MGHTKNIIRIAVPIKDGLLFSHFGHCKIIAVLDVDLDTQKITATENLEPPPHEPGIMPRWVSEKGVSLVLAGGMGTRAISFFEQFGVRVVTGCPIDSPKNLVRKYLKSNLKTGENVCEN